jgi:hypothetical protein
MEDFQLQQLELHQVITYAHFYAVDQHTSHLDWPLKRRGFPDGAT